MRLKTFSLLTVFLLTFAIGAESYAINSEANGAAIKRCDAGRCVINGSGTPCDSDHDCTFKACQDGRCMAGGAGLSCNLDSDCNYKRCGGNNHCMLGGQGQPCHDDTQCNYKGCSFDSPSRCVSKEFPPVSPCVSDRNCEDPFAKSCDGTKCSFWSGHGRLCASDSDCNYKTCEQRRCVAGGIGQRPCTLDTDCEAQSCKDGRCIVGGDGSASCSSDSDCSYRYCNTVLQQCRSVNAPGNTECQQNSDCGWTNKRCVTELRNMITRCVPTQDRVADSCLADEDCPGSPRPKPGTGLSSIAPEKEPSLMPLGDTEWGDEKGMLNDKASKALPPDVVKAIIAGRLQRGSSAPGSAVIFGSDNAPVTIAMFEDLTCGMCRKYFNEVFGSLKKDYIESGKVKFIFLEFPLGHIREDVAFSEAAKCAAKQNQFLPFISLVYTKGSHYSQAEIPELGLKLALNSAQFAKCIQSREFESAVEDDFETGSKLGVNGTPTFFLNGKELRGADTLAGLIQLVNQELR